MFWVLTCVGRILVNFIPSARDNILPTHIKTENTFWFPWIILILICLTVQILIRFTFLAKTSQILYDNIHIINLKLSVTLFINNENICLFPSISLLINSNKKKVSNMFVQDGHHYWELKFLQITIMCTEIEWD